MVAQPAVIIIETSKQLRLALLERLLPAPRINRGMGLFIIQTAVRAAVKRHQQQRPRLFGPDQRKNAPNGSEQLIEGFAVAQDGIGRKQHRIEFAAHHIAVQLEVGILLQDLRRQGPVGVCHPLGRVVAFQRFVESSREAVAVQARIDMAVVRIQRNHLILPGFDTEQRHIHAVLHTDHHLLAAPSRLNDDAGLNPLELPLGDADPVALHQSFGAGRVDRQHVRIGGSHPLQVLHRLVRKVGIVGIVLLADTGQEVILRQETFHPVDLRLRGVDEDVVVEQRMVRADQIPVLFPDLDVRRGKVFENRLSVSSPALQLHPQGPGRIPLIVALTRRRKGQHIPSDGIAVLSGTELLRDRICPVPTDLVRTCHDLQSKVKMTGDSSHSRANPGLANTQPQCADIQQIGFHKRQFVKIFGQQNPVDRPNFPKNLTSLFKKSHITAAKVEKKGVSTKKSSYFLRL